MASSRTPYQRSSPTKELFLDILTKEEKEALLTKKMEDLKRKNEMLKKRHEEIEADKQFARQISAKDPPVKDDADNWPRKPVKDRVGSPRKEASDFGFDDSRNHHQHDNRGRGRHEFGADESREHQNHGGRGGGGRGRQEFGADELRDHQNHGGRGGGGRGRQDHRGGRGRGRHINDDEEGRTPHHGGRRGRGRGNRPTSFHQHQEAGHEEGAWPPGGGRGGRQDHDGRADDRRAGNRRPPPGRTPTSPTEGGPPPDPAFNFLADRSRDRDEENYGPPPPGGSREEGSRRHPRNFGGTNFDDVKTRIQKERGKARFKGPPRSNMEMAMRMTGKERREYQEWKAERDRIDQARIQRQRDTGGDWRREWDHDKDENRYEDLTSPSATEPARRPAGRIGSGRFDRGDRQERQRGEGVIKKDGPPGGSTGDHGGGGGGRGGKGRGSSPRNRTTSSGSDEHRRVQKQEDSLVIKIDNQKAGRGRRTERGGRGRARGRGRGQDGSGGKGRGGGQSMQENNRHRENEKQGSASRSDTTSQSETSDTGSHRNLESENLTDGHLESEPVEGVCGQNTDQWPEGGGESWGEDEERGRAGGQQSEEDDGRYADHEDDYKDQEQMHEGEGHYDDDHHGDDDEDWEDCPEDEDDHDHHVYDDEEESKNNETSNLDTSQEVETLTKNLKLDITPAAEPTTPTSPEITLKTPVHVVDWAAEMEECFPDSSPPQTGRHDDEADTSIATTTTELSKSSDSGSEHKEGSTSEGITENSAIDGATSVIDGATCHNQEQDVNETSDVQQDSKQDSLNSEPTIANDSTTDSAENILINEGHSSVDPQQPQQSEDGSSKVNIETVAGQADTKENNENDENNEKADPDAEPESMKEDIGETKVDTEEVN